MSFFRTLFGGKKQEPAAPQPMRDVAALVATVEVPALHVVRASEPTLSHFGGDPRLPDGASWPVKSGEKLQFLARLSLTEIQAAQPTDWLPTTGALLFFYDIDLVPWHPEFCDRTSWAVCHVPDAPPEPGVVPKRGQLPHLPVAFRPIRILPDLARLDMEALNLTDSEEERYLEMTGARFGGHPVHQVLGLPYAVQHDEMERGCEDAYGDSRSSAADLDIEAASAKWRLLFQMDSDDDLEVMWGDVGIIYFWVEEERARAGDFSRVCLYLQSC